MKNGTIKKINQKNEQKLHSLKELDVDDLIFGEDQSQHVSDR